MGIGDYRVRVRIKANNPTSDNAGGYEDNYQGYDLEIGVFELWAKVKVKSGSRALDMEQTAMFRTYEIVTRAHFGYSMNYVPKKNMLIEIVGFTTNDATIQSVLWDDWNNEWKIEAVERL